MYIPRICSHVREAVHGVGDNKGNCHTVVMMVATSTISNHSSHGYGTEPVHGV